MPSRTTGAEADAFLRRCATHRQPRHSQLAPPEVRPFVIGEVHRCHRSHCVSNPKQRRRRLGDEIHVRCRTRHRHPALIEHGRTITQIEILPTTLDRDSVETVRPDGHLADHFDEPHPPGPFLSAGANTLGECHRHIERQFVEYCDEFPATSGRLVTPMHIPLARQQQAI